MYTNPKSIRRTTHSIRAADSTSTRRGAWRNSAVAMESRTPKRNRPRTRRSIRRWSFQAACRAGRFFFWCANARQTASRFCISTSLMCAIAGSPPCALTAHMQDLNVIDLIIAKREGQALDADQITALVVAFTSGKVPDYQMSAFLMAAFLRGMNEEETYAMTEAMWRSGITLDLSGIPGVKI